jgi:hypothetical protein
VQTDLDPDWLAQRLMIYLLEWLDLYWEALGQFAAAQ